MRAHGRLLVGALVESRTRAALLEKERHGRQERVVQLSLLPRGTRLVGHQVAALPLAWLCLRELALKAQANMCSEMAAFAVRWFFVVGCGHPPAGG